VSCRRRCGASSRFLRPHVRCLSLRSTRGAPQHGLGSWIWTPRFFRPLALRSSLLSPSRLSRRRCLGLKDSLAVGRRLSLEVFECFSSVFSRRKPASLEVHAATAPVLFAPPNHSSARRAVSTVLRFANRAGCWFLVRFFNSEHSPSVSVVPRAAGGQTVFHRARFSCVRMQSI
jgi:hypothetical protein